MAIKNIGAAWNKTSKNGNPMVSVSLNMKGKKVNFMLFKNTQKQNPGQPDWNAGVIVNDANAASAPVQAAPVTPAPANPVVADPVVADPVVQEDQSDEESPW